MDFKPDFMYQFSVEKIGIALFLSEWTVCHTVPVQVTRLARPHSNI